MSSPLMTDEEVEKEDSVKNESLEQIVKKSVKKNNGQNKTKNVEVIDKEILEETNEEIKQDIPQGFIEINLASNGKIEGIPKKLHFRCYSASDALDLNVDEEYRAKAISKVLTRLNYEKFDVGNLPIQDVIYILYILHSTFISRHITRKVYINEDLNEDEINEDENLEEVNIPINSIKFAYLGKDINDNDLGKIKVPFKVRDNFSNDSAKFRYTTLKDMVLAEAYCKNFYKDEFIKFAQMRTTINRIKKIRDEEKQDDELNNYLNANDALASEYYEFMAEYTLMLAKIIQAETIVEFNDEEITSLDKKWEIYNNRITNDMWDTYNDVIEKFPFGISDEIDVFIPSLQKVVHRRVGFQLIDFLHIDRHENINRCTVEFD